MRGRLPPTDVDADLVTRTDSSGIVVARSHGEAWPTGEGWTISDRPLLTIGSPDEGSGELHQVTAIVPLTAGRFVVGQESTHEVLWFDRRGEMQARAGGEGDGPGEFQRISGVFALGGDSVVVADHEANRLTTFAPTGTLVRVARLELGRGSNERPLLLAGGVLLTMGPTRIRVEPGAREGIFRDTAHLGRYALDGSFLGEIGPFPMDEQGRFMMGGMPFMGFSVFGKSTHLVPADSGFWIGTGDRPELELRATDGSLRRIVRWAGAPRPLTSEVVKAWEREAASRTEDPESPQSRLFLDGLRKTVDASTTIPSLSGLLIDADGNLWVEPFPVPGVDSVPPARMVFSPDGRRLGSVRFPERFRAMAIDGDRVYGVGIDELDVETVRVFALERKEF